MDMNAAIAFTRFGLGRRRDEAAPADARAWLLAQIDAPDPCPVAGLPSSADALAILWAFVQADHAKAKGDGQAAMFPEKQAFQDHVHGETMALLANAIETPAGFRERLVWFWANHLTVAATGRPAAACAGPYVREAIRPHVTGRFRDMLVAAIPHPAMLEYLNQAASVGPDSVAGQRKHAGLNENLARECLELHTVTPASGYSQADVTSFARMLTGCTVAMKEKPLGYRFRPALHEPGRQVVMGRTWPAGEPGVIAILRWLADHPCTRRHLATKLVQHFVADAPDAAYVARIEAVLHDTDGDLGAAAKAVVALPGAWQPLTKLRTPLEYVVAVMRAVGARPAMEPKLPEQIAQLGQKPFGAPFPIGWPDTAADWAGPEALLQRADFAYQFAARVTDQEPAEVGERTLGPLLGADTLAEVRRAGSRQDGLTLLLASPDFMRR